MKGIDAKSFVLGVAVGYLVLPAVVGMITKGRSSRPVAPAVAAA